MPEAKFSTVLPTLQSRLKSGHPHLCQKRSRIPTKGAYLQLMDLLSANLDIEKDDSLTSLNP